MSATVALPASATPSAQQVPASAKLTVTGMIGYGLGDLDSNLHWQKSSMFIAKYYTDIFLFGAACTQPRRAC